MKLLINDHHLNKIEKIQVGVSYFLQLTLVAALLYEIYKQDWLSVFALGGIFLLTSLPAILRKNYRVRLPVELDFIIIAFVYASVFLGMVQAFYDKIWWWDIFMHTSGGVLLGVAGFLLVYIINTNEKVNLNLSPFFVSLFAVSFANVMAVLWEIFEFSLDQFFATNMQMRVTGVVDTMGDLIVAEIGALTVAVLGYFYLKKQKPFAEKIIRKFLKNKWFRKRTEKKEYPF